MRRNLTQEEAQRFLEDLAEERAFESIAGLEEHLHELDIEHLEDIAERAAEYELQHLENLEHLIDLEHLAELDEHMAEMHERLGDIRVHVDIPPLPPIAVLPDVPFPAVAPLPDIDVPVIVDINAPTPVEFGIHGHTSSGEMKRLFPGISDDEILKS